MNTIDHMHLAAALVPSVLAAGAIEMRHYRAGVTVESKADQSPVTIADREAEAILVAAIAAAAPAIPIIAEEAVAAGTVPAIGAEFFLVDPLDGTREFIEQRGEFTVNIALVREGVPVFGIVYAPATEELYVTVGPNAQRWREWRRDAGRSHSPTWTSRRSERGTPIRQHCARSPADPTATPRLKRSSAATVSPNAPTPARR